MDDQVQVCLHCRNRVERILYKEEGLQLRGDIANEYKHSRPLKYTPCSKNPIMEEDVEWVNEAEV